ncbi:LVIVD repeat-containing protein [Cellulomonas hominis]|uniref:LVIVD repeat-containing protein n=1 Tax=Cellulomonas hominis TaxID=156981 RepID=UPI001B34F1B0
MTTPDFAQGFTFLGHSDQGGRPDGCQVMVHRGHVYVAHAFSGGFSVLDVRDPRDPRPVRFVAAPPGTWSVHLQTADDLLLVVNAKDLFADTEFQTEADYYTRSIGTPALQAARGYAAGLRVFDISAPAEPREIAFMPVEGVGLHRLWYTGGRWAYASALLDGFTDYVLVTIDLADPTRPQIAGRWWLPGMHEAAGETPTWDTGRWRYALHHAIVHGDTAYASWRDGGLTILDVSDRSAPSLVAARNWSDPFGGGTHTALPLPGRDLLLVADEGVADNAADGIKHTWVFDVRNPANPVSIATFPQPAEDDFVAKGGHFGPHNLHENRPGSFQSEELVFATYQNAGVRAFDLRDPYRPELVAGWVPPAPERMVDTRPGRPRVIQSFDVFVDAEGVAYVTDYNAGLYVLQYDGS